MSLLLRTVSYANMLIRVPPYMGPPTNDNVLHVIRMWNFPYVLDTMSLAMFGASIGLILIGIAVYIRNRKRLQQRVDKSVTEDRDSLYPYH